ncbi:MAG: hypothetical protein LBB35_02535 [Coriobacteriaceae bacterium]|jgi:hypothetical protein|nr:hypothetical protein [Coriobacteriaceae bacterium]
MTDTIERLVNTMPGTRGLLFGIMEFCREAQEPAEIDSYVTEQLQYYPSVHSPVEFRSFLEKAGALDFLPTETKDSDAEASENAEAPETNEGDDAVNADDVSDTTDASDTADAVEEKKYATDFPVDEEGFLIPAPERLGLWQTSEQGKAYLASVDYQKRFEELLQVDQSLSGIYYEILELCSDEPQSIDDLNSKLKTSLETLNSKKYAGFFVERLENYDALKWEKKWKTTEVGKELLVIRKKNEQL